MKNLATFLFLVLVLLGAGAAKADRVKDLNFVFNFSHSVYTERVIVKRACETYKARW